MRLRFQTYLKTSIFTIFLATILLSGASFVSGEVITDEMIVPSLAGNLLDDPSDRPMVIYLPQSYDEGVMHYPVVYYLHGYTANERDWLGYGIDTAMDELIEQGEIQEMIIVMPNAHNKYDGSWYANSSVAGNYEDYITGDLVEFIDGKYRTLPQRESRAIAGGSMGGHGAMKLAIKHTDIYSVVVSHSGVLSLNLWRRYVPFINSDRSLQAMAIAFSPNPDVARLYDVPTSNEDWDRWLAHDPVTLAQANQEELKQMAGIYFDHGTSDTTVEVSHAREFDKALTQAGIPHVYEEHDGNHVDIWPARLRVGLPFLSNLLSSDMLTPVQLTGRLAITWASLKVK